MSAPRTYAGQAALRVAEDYGQAAAWRATYREALPYSNDEGLANTVYYYTRQAANAARRAYPELGE